MLLVLLPLHDLATNRFSSGKAIKIRENDFVDVTVTRFPAVLPVYIRKLNKHNSKIMPIQLVFNFSEHSILWVVPPSRSHNGP